MRSRRKARTTPTTDTVLRLRAHDVWTALEDVDPIEVLAEDLIRRTIAPPENRHREAGRLTPVDSGAAGLDGFDSELVLLSHPNAITKCVLPAACLRTALSAALSALAARELLHSGGATVAVLGPLTSVQASLAIIARHVPDISHVALCFAGGTTHVEPRLREQMELRGILLSVVSTPAEAVFGANLVIVTNHDEPRLDLTTLRLGELARGAVLVNATGQDLSPDLVEQVDQIFVEAFGVLEKNLDRWVAAAHLTEPTADPAGPRPGTHPWITADLGQLLTGRHPGRDNDGIALVELLDADQLNTELAYRIYKGAVRAGVGVRMAEPGRRRP